MNELSADDQINEFYNLNNSRKQAQLERDETIREIDLGVKRSDRQHLNPVAKGFMGGAQNVAGMAHGAAGAFNSAFGDKEAAGKSFVQARNRMDAAETYQEDVKFFSADREQGAFGSMGNFGRWAGKTTGELLPFMAEMILAGAIGGAAGSQAVPGIGPDDAVAVPAGAAAGVGARLFGKRVLREMVEEQAERFLKGHLAKGVAQEQAESMARREALKFVAANKSELFPAAAKKVGQMWGSRAGVMSASSAMEGGGMWADGMKEGYDNPYSAIMLGMLSGSSEVFLGNVPMAMRSIFGGKSGSTLSNALRKVAGQKGPKKSASFLWDISKNMGEEGFQEAFQEMLSSVNQEINDPDFKITSKETFMQWAESAAAGSLGGLVFGAPVSVRNAVSQKLEGGSDTATDMDTGEGVGPNLNTPIPNADEISTDEQLTQIDEERDLIRESDPERAAELDKVYESALDRMEREYISAAQQQQADLEQFEYQDAVGQQAELEDQFQYNDATNQQIEAEERQQEQDVALLEAQDEEQFQYRDAVEQQADAEEELQYREATQQQIEEDEAGIAAEIRELRRAGLTEREAELDGTAVSAQDQARLDTLRQDDPGLYQALYDQHSGVKHAILEELDSEAVTPNFQEQLNGLLEGVDDGFRERNAELIAGVEAAVNGANGTAAQEGLAEIDRKVRNWKAGQRRKARRARAKGEAAARDERAKRMPEPEPTKAPKAEEKTAAKSEPSTKPEVVNPTPPTKPALERKVKVYPKKKSEPRGADNERHILTSAGKPFKTIPAAKRAAGKVGLGLDDVVEVQGGYAVKRPRSGLKKAANDKPGASTVTNEEQPTSPPTDQADQGRGGQGKPDANPPASSSSVKNKPAAAAKENLEDFGEKLGGARKDTWAPSLKDQSDDDLSTQPLSKIWPKKDIESIEAVPEAAVATVLRDSIPNKPRKAYAVAGWVKKVRQVQSLLEMAQEMGSEKFISKLRSATGMSTLPHLADKIELMTNIDRSDWKRVGEVRRYPNAYRFVERKKVPSPTAHAFIDKRIVETRGDASMDALLNAVKERLGTEVKAPRMAFEVRGHKGAYGINKKGDKLYRKLKMFDDSKQAFAYVKENYDELVNAWEEVKARENVSKKDVRGKVNRKRVGADHRKGKDVTPERFTETFGFRGVEFGNWVSQGKTRNERQGMLNAAYDALMDMANVLNIPPRAVSLNGKLGLGLGSRGSGSASAHYEPGKVVINLTKTRGAGSLAHEWFHALDNYFQRKRGGGSAEAEPYITYQPEVQYKHKSGYKVSESRYKQMQQSGAIRPVEVSNWTREENLVRPEVHEAFTELVKALDDSPMAKRSRKIDGGRSKVYWSQIIERAARAFENYMIAKMQREGYHNDYLANVTSFEDFARDKDSYPYLLESELPPVEAAFDKLFTTIETREGTDGGVELFRTGEDKSSETSPGMKKARRVVKNLLGPNVSVQAVDKMLTPQGQNALGSYRNALVTLVNKPSVLDTAHHEAVHAAIDLFLTPEEKTKLFDSERSQGMSDLDVEEKIAEEFIQYAKDRSGFKAKVKRIASKVMRAVKALVGYRGKTRAIDTTRKLYDQMLSGELKQREQQVSADELFYSTRKDVANFTQEDGLRNLEWLQSAEPTASVKGDEVPAEVRTKKETIEWGAKNWEERGLPNEVPQVDLGDIRLDKGSLKKSVNHGIGNKKRVAIHMLHDAVMGSRLLGLVPQKNPGMDGFILGAPVEINGARHELVFMVLRDVNIQRLYIHEAVLLDEKNNPRGSVKTAAKLSRSKPHGEPRGIIYNFMKELLEAQEEKKNNPPDNPQEVKYRTEEQAEQRKEGETLLQRSRDEAAETLKAFLNKRKDANAKTDISAWDTLAGTISFYSSKVPALRRLFEAAQQLRDDKHFFAEDILGEGEKDIGDLRRFKNKNKSEYERLNQYIVERDRNAVGYTVKEDRTGRYVVRNPDGDAVSYFEAEGPAWEFAFKREVEDYIKAGGTELGGQMLLKYRQIGNRLYNQTRGEILSLKEYIEQNGTNDQIQKMSSDLFDALKQMGDRRGHYMPRKRKPGKYLLYAQKEGEAPILETFTHKTLREKQAREYEKEGYKTTLKISETPSEDAFMDAGVVALNDMIQNALKKLENSADAVTLDDVGVSYKTIDYNLKDGGAEPHLVLTDEDLRPFTRILKSFGGVRYDDKQNGLGEVWRFKNPTPELKKALAQAMFLHQHGTIEPMQKFTEQLNSQLAEEIHSRGSRSSKIGRNVAVGDDVWRGYEEDSVRAMTMAAKSTAGGTAKRQMAQRMTKIITGMDIDWGEYREAHMKENGAVEGDYTASTNAWKDYQKEVNERRIDSATQPNSYKEAVSYSRDMLRNEENSERIIGQLRGLAAFKHLSGVSSGIVNLTALGTTVPAAMKAFGNIDLRKTPGLLARGARNYGRYYMHSRFGKGESLKGEDAWLFDQISSKGWDDALQNEEAVKVLQNSLQSGWSNVMDKAMFVFSTTERINRGSTIAAAYYGLRSQGLTKEAALDQAKEISDKAHGIYGKTNLPSWARGSSLGAQAMRSFYMYKTFTHNYAQVLGQMIGKRDPKSVAFMLAAPAILAGPGASLVTPVATHMINAIFSAVGLEPPDDLEEEFYLWVNDTFGDTAGRFARTGAVGGLTGVNMKGSLAVEFEDFIPKTIPDLLGAPYSLVEDTFKGAGNLARGDTLKGLEQLSPRFIASPIKAVRESTEGVTSRNNQPVFYGTEPLKANMTDAMLRMLSFNPARTSIKREEQWNERQVEDRYRDDRTDIYARMRRWRLSNGSMAEWADLLRDVEEYNARVRKSRFRSLSYITPASIKTQLRNMDRPKKRERIRAGEATQNDPGAVEFTSADGGAGAQRRSARRDTRRNIR